LLPNPILSLAVRFPEGGGKSIIEAGVAADLLSLLSRPGRISAADQRLRKSTADALVVVLDVIAEVQQQYTTVQSLAARAAIDESQRSILTDLVTVTEARQRAGEAARLDVLTVQSEQATREVALLGLRSEERQARLTLARLIGQPTSAATWQLEDWSEPAAMPDDEPYWLELAHQQRPELRVVAWELAALGDDLRVAKFALFESTDVGVAAERDGDWSVGPAASVPIPLFDVGQADRDRVRAQIIERRHDLTRTERLIVQEVRIAIEQLRSSNAALLAVKNRSLPLQEQRLTQARNSYRSGVADVLAVRLAERDLQEARSQEIELQAQVSQARSRLIRAAGGMKLSPTTQPTTRNTTETP
jgi:outer membrane protein TolC